MIFPKECEILRIYNDQIASCYINPLQNCPHFYECLKYLAEGKKELTESEKKRRRQEFGKIVAKVEIPDDVCCCCGHKLGNHIDEREGWRCHSLGQDFYQCECYLRKNRSDEGIKWYDLKLRVIQMKEDLKKEMKQ